MAKRCKASFWSGENVIKLIAASAAQICCEYTKSQQIVQVKWVNFMVCELSLNIAVFKNTHTHTKPQKQANQETVPHPLVAPELPLQAPKADGMLFEKPWSSPCFYSWNVHKDKNPSPLTPSPSPFKLEGGAHLRVDTVGLGLTVHVQALHDDGQLHLTWHVSQWAHGHSQLLLGDEAIPISVQNPKGLSDFYKEKAKKVQWSMAWSIALTLLVTAYWKLLTAF